MLGHEGSNIVKSSINHPLQPSPASLAVLKLLEEGFVVVFSTHKEPRRRGKHSVEVVEAGRGDLTTAQAVKLKCKFCTLAINFTAALFS